MAQMLAGVVNECQDWWDVHLPHMEFAHYNAVSAASGLGPNEVNTERLLRFPMTFDILYTRDTILPPTSTLNIETLLLNATNKRADLFERSTSSTLQSRASNLRHLQCPA